MLSAISGPKYLNNKEPAKAIAPPIPPRPSMTFSIVVNNFSKPSNIVIKNLSFNKTVTALLQFSLENLDEPDKGDMEKHAKDQHPI